jgi:hypothetical protein
MFSVTCGDRLRFHDLEGDDVDPVVVVKVGVVICQGGEQGLSVVEVLTLGILVGQLCDFPAVDVREVSIQAPDPVPVIKHEHRRSHLQGIAVSDRGDLSAGHDAVEVTGMEVHDPQSRFAVRLAIAAREQIADGPGLQLTSYRHDGVDVRMKVEQDLTATAAR